MTDRLLTRRFSALITGHLGDDVAPQELADGIAETSHCGSNGVLVPGVLTWENVTAEGDGLGGVTITAELLACDLVPGGDYEGDEVTEDHVADYITNAGPYWYGQGDEFFPDTVIITRTA